MAARYSLKNHLRLLPSLCLLLSLPVVVTPTTTQELDTALSVLRRRGYNLFSNAISTSGFRFVLLSTPSFTLFAPPDSSLFAPEIDLTPHSNAYRSILRTHAVPNRLSAADLRRRHPSSFIPTFLRSRSLRITFCHRHHVEGFVPYIIVIDGVNVTSPGLYYGRNVAVHGLGGVLNFRFQDACASRNSSNHKSISNLPEFQHPNQTDRKPFQGHKNKSHRHGVAPVPIPSPPPVILGHPTNPVTAPSVSPGLALAHPPISVSGLSPDMISTPIVDKNREESNRRGYWRPMMPPLRDEENGGAGDPYGPWDQRIDYLDVVRFWDENPHM